MPQPHLRGQRGEILRGSALLARRQLPLQVLGDFREHIYLHKAFFLFSESSASYPSVVSSAQGKSKVLHSLLFSELASALRNVVTTCQISVQALPPALCPQLWLFMLAKLLTRFLNRRQHVQSVLPPCCGREGIQTCCSLFSILDAGYPVDYTQHPKGGF